MREKGSLSSYVAKVPRFDEKRYFSLQEEMAKFYETERQGLLYVERDFVGTDPIIIVPVGDLHWGHLATDYKFIIFELLKFIVETPNAYGLGIGDNTEAFLAHLVDTVVAQTPFGFQTQIDRFDEHFLSKVYQKMLAQVADGYKGHDGSWPGKMTLNPIYSLGNKYNIPNIINGATLKLNFRESEGPDSPIIQSVVLRVFHDPGHASQIDPSRQGREAVAWADQLKIDGVVHGHVHDNYVSAEPITVGNKQNPSHVFTIISPGTPKGSGGVPVVDKFRAQVKGGELFYDEPNATLTIAVSRPDEGTAKKNVQLIGTNTLREGNLVYQAVRALERAESQGLTHELVERIRGKYPAPTVVFDRLNSVSSNEPHNEAATLKRKEAKKKGQELEEVVSPPVSEKENTAVQYRTAQYEIESELPLGVTLVANLRIGSEGSMPWRDSLNSMIGEIAEDPYRFAILLRHLIDKDTANNPHRLPVLRETIKIFELLSGNHKILALLLDEELRHKAWKRSIKDVSAPLMPGTMLAAQLNTILISNKADLSLKIVGAEFNPFHLVALDKLERYGTTAHPCQGLISQYVRRMRGVPRPDIVAGGHFGAGIVSMFHGENPNTKWPKFIAPGYFAPVIDGGSSNVHDGPEGGQGFIIYPDKREKLVFPMVNTEAGEFLFKALFLQKGLQLLGEYNRVVNQSKKRKKA